MGILKLVQDDDRRVMSGLLFTISNNAVDFIRIDFKASGTEKNLSHVIPNLFRDPLNYALPTPRHPELVSGSPVNHFMKMSAGFIINT